MSTTIESLELEITGNASGAESSLNKLAETLGKLRDATKGGIGLTAVSKQLKTLSDSAKGVDPNAAKNVEGIAKAISLLSGVKVSASIGNQLTSINTAISSLSLSGGETKIRELVSVLTPLGDLPKSNLSSFVTSLKKLPEVLGELNKMDMSAFTAKIQEVTNAVKPLADEMYKVAQGFSAFPSKIQKLITSTNKLSVSNKKAAGTYVDLYSKMKTAYYSITRIASMIGSAIKQASSQVETINFFNVSMKQYANEAGKYAEKVSELMGVDPVEWMRDRGTFMTLATGFGVVGDRAYVMSQQLTQLGHDIASYNDMSVSDAMLKIQSGFAGELEPLRRIGYDLSQAKLEATALSLGIDKAVSSMTQAEKAELRYYAIMTQVTNSHGDMARTLESPANQMRIFKAQLTQCARAIGSIFIPALAKILPYVTAVVKVIRILAENIANLFGFTLPEVDWKGGENATGNIQQNLEGANEAAKKLKNATMGFDELNILSTGSGGDEGALGTGFDFELPTYDFLEGVTKNKINSITKEMKKWLGITDDINSWSDIFKTKLGLILGTVGLIGTALMGWKIATGVSDTIKVIKSLETAGSVILGLTLVVTGITIGALAIESALTEGLNSVNVTSLLTASALVVAGGALIGKAFGHALIGAGIGAIISGVAGLGVGLYDAISKELNVTNGLLIVFSTALIGFGIATLIPTLSLGMGAIIGAITGAAIAGALWIVQNTEDTVSKVGAIISGAFLAIGAVLAFTGINVPLGVALLAVGALSMATTVAMNTNALSDDVKGVIATITSAVSVALLAVGAVLAFSGVNIPLGIALMAGGALTLATAIAPSWGKLSDSVKEDISTITAIVGGSLLALGAVLAFSGVALPLGITLMVLGAASLGTAVALNWDSVVKALRGPVGLITGIVSGALLALGAVLAFSGVGLPLGIALMAAGAVGLVTVTALNWNKVKNTLKTTFTSILAIISGAMLVLGVLLCLSGAGIGLGLALIAGGVAGTITAWKLDDNPVTRFVKNMVNGIIKIINMAISAINEMFHIQFDGLTIAGIEVIPAFNIRMVNIPKIPLMADGGIVNQGQMFIAREAGAELVGSIGRRTAVMNNDQIVESVSNGVAVANEEQNALLREQNTLLRAILQKDTGVTLDGKTLTKSVEKYQRERGATIYTGGVLNGV